jgi:hypothetical protein
MELRIRRHVDRKKWRHPFTGIVRDRLPRVAYRWLSLENNTGPDVIGRPPDCWST